MSVTSSLTLPAQGASGTVRYIALGGDGFSSPKGMYTIVNFNSIGDGGGGFQRCEIVMDELYCSMIGYASMTATAAGDIDVRWTLVGAAQGAVPLQVRANLKVAGSSTLNAATVNDLWLPPAHINPGGPAQVPTLAVTIVESNAVVMQLNAVIFTYDIRAREAARYAALVSARGGI